MLLAALLYCWKKFSLHDLCWRVCKQHLFSTDVNAAVLSYVDACRHLCLLWKLNKNFHGDVSNPVWVSYIFSSAHIQNWTCSFSFFHIFVNCCHVWNRSIRTFLSEFVLAIFVGSAFSVYIVQTDNILQWCLHWNWRQISQLQTCDYPNVTDWVLVAWWVI
jgi:hypothetical protein